MPPTCSKCEELAEHSIIIRDDGPAPDPDTKDQRRMNIFRFCNIHWDELLHFIGAKDGT